MEVKFLNQPKEIKLGDILNQRLKESFTNVYLVAGMVKDTGFEVVYDALKESAEGGSKIKLYVGIDRKNTSKDMLLKLISIGCNLNVHINTDDNKVETRIYAFESESKESYIYVAGSKFSCGGLEDNSCTIIEVKYGINEKRAFDVAKNSILKGATDEFHEVNETEIKFLAEKGDIVARIIDRKIPKITEMYGSAEQIIGEQIYDESRSNSIINTQDFEDVDIAIDLGVGIRENVELATEKEAKKEQKEKEALLQSIKDSGSDIDKLYNKKEDVEEVKQNVMIHMSNKIDYENMTTLIIESNKIIEKGAGAGELKIPKLIADNMMKFFDGESQFNHIDDEKWKTQIVSFEILDNRTNSNYSDDKVKVMITDKGISIKSETIISLMLDEGDIVRIIKGKEKTYECEIIRQDTEEFGIWSAYCRNSLRGHKRRFGVI